MRWSQKKTPPKRGKSSWEITDFLGSRGNLTLLQEAFTAIHRSALSGFEWYSGFLPTVRAGCHGFNFYPGGIERLISFSLALLAPFRLVSEVLRRVEELFACRKNKLSTTVYANNCLILVFHSTLRSINPFQMMNQFLELNLLANSRLALSSRFS